MRIQTSKHLLHPWEAHQLLSSFKIEDTWQLPVVLRSHHTLDMVQKQFVIALSAAKGKGFSGILFDFRLFLGRIFNWDKKNEQTKLTPGSIREAYALKKNLTFAQLPPPGDGDFIPVYNLEKESLAEIENATVHAALHFGHVPLNQKHFTVQMTIYVKPKGLFGKCYMLLIKPFRLFIIYPAMLRTIKIHWEQYLDIESTKGLPDL